MPHDPADAKKAPNLIGRMTRVRNGICGSIRMSENGTRRTIRGTRSTGAELNGHEIATVRYVPL